MIEVKEGAVSVCGYAVRVLWDTCGGSANNESAPSAFVGEGVVMVQLPAPVSAAASANRAKLTVSGDGASKAPFNVGTSTTLRVVVSFEDNTSRDFSTDSRTVYRARSTADNGCAGVLVLSGNTVTVNPLAKVTPSLVCSVDVSFTGGILPAQNFTATVGVVVFALLELHSLPYPLAQSYPHGDFTALHRIACTRLFQRLQARATGRLSDGTTKSNYDFYRRVTYSTTNSTVGYFGNDEGGRALTVRRPGSIDLWGVFWGVNARR
jgi:hypothetical protein